MYLIKWPVSTTAYLTHSIVNPGVLVLSWYPPGVADDHGEPAEDLVPAVMDAAHRHSIKVTGETTGMFFSFLMTCRMNGM